MSPALPPGLEPQPLRCARSIGHTNDVSPLKVPRRTSTMDASYYRLVPLGGRIVVSNRLEGIRRYVEDAGRPEGRYEILAGNSTLLMCDPEAHRWGVAIKHPDGTVELIQAALAEYPNGVVAA